MDTPLEDIPEYEKYKGSIRSIDKLIEKIALVSNISYYVGLSPTVKSRRKAVTKDVIDIVLENNRILKRNYKERNEKASAKKKDLTLDNINADDIVFINVTFSFRVDIPIEMDGTKKLSSVTCNTIQKV